MSGRGIGSGVALAANTTGVLAKDNQIDGFSYGIQSAAGCRTHRMITRKGWTVLNFPQPAAPANVSTRGLQDRCSIVRIKDYRSWRYQETFAGAACQHTISLPNPMFQSSAFNSGQ